MGSGCVSAGARHREYHGRYREYSGRHRSYTERKRVKRRAQRLPSERERGITSERTKWRAH